MKSEPSRYPVHYLHYTEADVKNKHIIKGEKSHEKENQPEFDRRSVVYFGGV